MPPFFCTHWASSGGSAAGIRAWHCLSFLYWKNKDSNLCNGMRQNFRTFPQNCDHWNGKSQMCQLRRIRNNTKSTPKMISTGMVYIFRSAFFAKVRSNNTARSTKTTEKPRNSVSKNKNALCSSAAERLPLSRALTKCVPPQVGHFAPNRCQGQMVFIFSICSLRYQKNSAAGAARRWPASRSPFLCLRIQDIMATAVLFRMEKATAGTIAFHRNQMICNLTSSSRKRRMRPLRHPQLR